MTQACDMVGATLGSLELQRLLWRCRMLCILLWLSCTSEISSRTDGGVSSIDAADDRNLRIEFNTCDRWQHDMGIRGKIIVPPSAKTPVVELESCGLSPVCQIDLDLVQRFLLAAIGPLDITAFFVGQSGDFAVSCDQRSVRLQAFAEVAAASLLRGARPDQGQLGTASSAPTCLADSAMNATGDVAIERAVVEGLAAAGSPSFLTSACSDSAKAWVDNLVFPNKASSYNIRSNHSALAAVTLWMRDRESSLEWNAEHDKLRSECLAEGDLKGYECRTFTYGSTYFPSWLRVMRFPAVAEALKDGQAARDREVVVLGSSLGWQTLWIGLTFGIRTVGYELMDHRVYAARLAAAHIAESTDGLVQFHHKDALSSDLSNAVVIYLTDLIWEDYLVVQVANHVKQSLVKSGIGRRAVVISNKYSSWSKMKFEHLGTLEVPVSWTAKQEFHYWRLSPYASHR